MEKYHDSVTSALLQLFRDPKYLPKYPFKLLIQSLLRDEVVSGTTSPDVRYMSIDAEKLHLFIKMVAYGETGFCGSMHIAKLITSASTKAMLPVVQQINKALGDQAQHIKTEQIEVDVIDVYSCKSFFNPLLSQPRQHRIDLTVEIIISAKSFDECVNLFIRRVLGDAHAAELSHEIIVAQLRTVASNASSYESGQGHLTEGIDVTTIREKRQQVLSMLKAVLLNEGGIYLDFYIRITRTLHSHHAESAVYAEQSEGYVHVRRWYNLSFCNDKQHVRCFAKNPLHSICFGIFCSLREADRFVAVYTSHLKRMKQKGVDENNQMKQMSKVGIKSTIMLNQLITTICERIIEYWDRGEMVDAAETILLFLAIISCEKKQPSHAMKEVQLISGGAAGHFCAVRDAAAAIRDVVDLLIRDLRVSAAVTAQVRGLALTVEQQQEIEVLKNIFTGLTPAVKQLRGMLIELVRVESYSELQYTAHQINRLSWELFDPIKCSLPILHPDVCRLQELGLAAMEGALLSARNTLDRITYELKMLELTISTETILSIINVDLTSYRSYASSGDKDVDELHRLRQYRGHEDMPRNLIDILGYAFSRCNYVKDRRHTFYTEFVWSPLEVSETLRRQLISLPESNFSSSEIAEQDLQSMVESRITKTSHLWDFYALLGEYSVHRLGAIDCQLAVEEELLRSTFPDCMAVEAMKLRYLQESGVLESLHAVAFSMNSEAKHFSSFSFLNRSCFHRMTWSVIFDGVSDTLIEDYAFQPARRNRVRTQRHRRKNPRGYYLVTGNNSNPGVVDNEDEEDHVDDVQSLTEEAVKSSQRTGRVLDIKDLKLRIANRASGYYRIPLPDQPYALRGRLGGCIIGSDRILSALGPHAEDLFTDIWQLPPLFPASPSPATGMKVNLYCGMAATCAAELSKPLLHDLKPLQDLLRAEDERQAYTEYYEGGLGALQQRRLKWRRWRLFDRLFSRRSTNKAVVNDSMESRNSIRIRHGDSKKDLSHKQQSLNPNDLLASEQQLLNDYTDDMSDLEIVADDEVEDDNPNFPGIEGIVYRSNDRHGATLHQSIDFGNLRTPSPIMELEVVIRIEYEDAGAITEVKEFFAQQVVRSLHYMRDSSDWKVRQLIVHRDPEKTSHIGSKPKTLASIFSAEDLMADEQSKVQQLIRNAIARHATANVDCAVRLPVRSRRIPLSELYDHFGKCFRTSSSNDFVNLQPAMPKGSSSLAPTASNPLQSGPVSNEPPIRSHSGALAPAIRIVDYGTDEGDVLQSLCSIEEDSDRHYRKPSNLEDEDSDDDATMSSDPTRDDRDRICADSTIAQLLSRRRAMGAASGDSNSDSHARVISTYSPCTIRFTLLAQHRPRPLIGRGLIKPAQQTRFTVANNSKREFYSKIIGNQTIPYSIGSESSIARLVASTLWFSKAAGSAIWSSVVDGEAHCTYHEAQEHLWGYHSCRDTGNICAAYQHAMVSCLLSQQYQLVTPLYRSFNALCFPFRTLVERVRMCSDILSSGNINKCDINALGHTITRDICLQFRLALTSPQAGHLRGGVAYLLKLLQQLEDVLHLISIPVDLAIGSGSQHNTSTGTASETTAPSDQLPDQLRTASVPIQHADMYKLMNPIVHSYQDPELVAQSLSQQQTDDAKENQSNVKETAAEFEDAHHKKYDAPKSSQTVSLPISALGIEEGATVDMGGVELRKALSRAQNLQTAVKILDEIAGMSQSLLSILQQDMDDNCSVINDCFRVPEYSKHRNNYDVRINSNSSIDLREKLWMQNGREGWENPIGAASGQDPGQCLLRSGGEVALRIRSAREILPVVLGKHATLSALVSYVQRAETATNSMLSDARFAEHLLSAEGMRAMKAARATALSIEAIEKMNILKRVSSLSKNCTVKERRSIKEFVQEVLGTHRNDHVNKEEETVPVEASPVDDSIEHNSQEVESKKEQESSRLLKRRIKPSQLLRGKTNAVRSVVALLDQLHSHHFGDSAEELPVTESKEVPVAAVPTSDDAGDVTEANTDNDDIENNERVADVTASRDSSDAVDRKEVAADDNSAAIEAASIVNDKSSVDAGASVDINSIIESIFGGSKPMNYSNSTSTGVGAFSRQPSVSTLTLSDDAEHPIRSTSEIFAALPNRDAGIATGGYQPKIVLSRFHDEAIAAKREQQLTARLEEKQLNSIAEYGHPFHLRSEVIPEVDGDDAEYYYFNRNCGDAQSENFSASGFKAARELEQRQRTGGRQDSVSMLSLLRDYAGVQAPPIAAPHPPPNPQQRRAPAPHPQKKLTATSSQEGVNVLQALRALPKTDYQHNSAEHFL